MSTCQFNDSNNNLHTFVHIPKTGGQSITNWLNKYTKIKRFGMHDTVDDVKKQTSNIGHSFAIVRNPYDRLVSVYLYQRDGALRQINSLEEQLTQEGRRKEWIEKKAAVEIQSLKASEMGFKNFLKYMIKHDMHFGLASQVFYTKDVDTIIKFENLNDDFETHIRPLFSKDYGYKLPHDNKSIKHNYKKFYDLETVNITLDLFIDDFKQFNYNTKLKTKY